MTNSVIRNLKARWEYARGRTHYRLWNLPFLPVVPYPLRAAKISIDIGPFHCWWRPQFCHFPTLTEQAKEEGSTIWYARWLFFQISYGRWL